MDFLSSRQLLQRRRDSNRGDIADSGGDLWRPGIERGRRTAERSGIRGVFVVFWDRCKASLDLVGGECVEDCHTTSRSCVSGIFLFSRDSCKTALVRVSGLRVDVRSTRASPKGRGLQAPTRMVSVVVALVRMECQKRWFSTKPLPGIKAPLCSTLGGYSLCRDPEDRRDAV